MKLINSNTDIDNINSDENNTNTVDKSKASTDAIMLIRHLLESFAEEKYKEFTASLLPGVDNILGVRLPRIREIAKKLSENEILNYLDYYNTESEQYFEEIMLQGFAIGRIKDNSTAYSKVKEFLIKINNWSVCDSFCSSLKIVKSNREQYFSLAKQCIVSGKTYYQRFAVVLLLNYYITDDYIDSVLELLKGIKSDEYYVNMAVAWAISICFIFYSEKTIVLLENNILNDFTHNKSIQKIRESLRVNADVKEKLKYMKR